MSGDILFLAHRVPDRPDRGDKIRSHHVLRHLANRARVHCLAFADDAAEAERARALEPFVASCRTIVRTKPRWRAAAQAIATRAPVSLTAFADPRMQAAVDRVLRERPIAAIYAFSGQMAQYLPVGGPQVIMDFVDIDSAKFAAYAAKAHGPMRWMLSREARLLGNYEAAVTRRVDASLFVSEAEAALFRERTRATNVVAVENGIDTRVFAPDAEFERVDATGPLIVFTGQMDYPPNIEAVVAFARTVLPLVRSGVPEARFAIVGRAPVADVRNLASLPGVLVTGEVDDVRGWLAAADIVVAPLMLARGIQNKVLEAMAMARPVLASSAAAEGIDHRATIRIADGARAQADGVLALLADREAATALGRSARARVIDRYGWAARLTVLDTLLDRSCERRARAA